jgi:hypothetical protein
VENCCERSSIANCEWAAEGEVHWGGGGEMIKSRTRIGKDRSINLSRSSEESIPLANLLPWDFVCIKEALARIVPDPSCFFNNVPMLLPTNPAHTIDSHLNFPY